MATTEKPLDIYSYIAIGLRRKWYIIIPLVLSIMVSYIVYKKLPKIYSATTLILVQSQRIPTEYVRSTITDTVSSRLNTLSQEILSRTRLEKVIYEFNLYGDLLSTVPMEGVVETMRKAIQVRLESQPQFDERGQNSFSITFEGKEPRTVMVVTNKLASLFIEENLKVREQQAEKTSEFLIKELSMMEDKLRRKEVEIRAFKERHMGQLPEQLDANLRILERLQDQLNTISENIRAAEDRAILVRSQIDQLRERGQGLLARQTRRESTSRELTSNVGDGESDQGFEDPLITQYNQLKRDLAAAQSKYTENHPDVIDLKNKIAKLEPRVKEAIDKQTTAREGRLKILRERDDTGTGVDLAVAVLDPALDRLLAQYTEQYHESQLEARRLKEEEKSLKEQIVLYRRRIEETPRGEQELALLTRDYDLSKANYQSLMDKKLQAQMAENLERNQQGEQFKILDPARIPENPIKPNRNKILLVGVFMGLSMGVGLAWFRESLDQSFHAVSDIEDYLELPVVATIPYLQEDEKKAA